MFVCLWSNNSVLNSRLPVSRKLETLVLLELSNLHSCVVVSFCQPKSSLNSVTCTQLWCGFILSTQVFHENIWSKFGSHCHLFWHCVHLVTIFKFHRIMRFGVRVLLAEMVNIALWRAKSNSNFGSVSYPLNISSMHNTPLLYVLSVLTCK